MLSFLRRSFYFLSYLAYQLNATKSKPHVSAVVFYSSVGLFNWNFRDQLMADFWKEKLEAKLDDATWPVNASVEVIDVRSNATYMIEYARARLADSASPPVGVFIFDTLGVQQMSWFAQFNIPCIICADSPNKFTQNLDQGPDFERTFFMQPPAQYYFKSLAIKYLQLGVKSVVAIADNGDSVVNPGIDYSFSREQCFLAAQEIMAPNGIEVLGMFEFNIFTADKSDYISIIEQTRELNPDALILCDIAAPYNPYFYDKWILKVLRELNYLPKALNILSLTGTELGRIEALEGTLQYMTQITFSHPDLKGIDYTEDSAPYSSNFVQSTIPATAAELLLYGSAIGNQSSSAKLFFDWYSENAGIYPRSQAVAIYATFDVVEAAMYRAALVESIRADGKITGEELYQFIASTNVATPYGRVIFNSHQINTKTYAAVEQYFDKSVTTTLVAPDEESTRPFVYPMPSWDERTYHWSIFKGDTNRGIIFASIMTFILLTIGITIIIYRKEANVKMLQFAHVLSMIIASLVVIWSLVFVWQADVRQFQCDALLWTIYLPGSYVIQLANMKAYRLSVFLTSESKQIKRKLTHNYILMMALGWVAVTAVLLLVAQFIDPPTKTTIILDQYRPSKNYNICRYHRTTSAILYFLVVEHIIISAYCTIAVRNGSEAFKDGLVMKESFILLFGFIIVAFIFGQLGLNANAFYFVRTLFVGLGFSLFCVRLLLPRCLVHWLPPILLILIMKAYRALLSWFPESKTTSKVHAASLASVSNLIGDLAVQEVQLLSTDDADEMTRVLHDDRRYQILCDLAKKGFLLENVEFLKELESFPERCVDIICKESSVLRGHVVDIVADQICQEYCVEGGNKEVNLSHAVRTKLRNDIESMKSGKPLIQAEQAKEILFNDIEKVLLIFDGAQKEIRQVLFQNIWEKFKTADTESQMV